MPGVACGGAVLSCLQSLPLWPAASPLPIHLPRSSTPLFLPPHSYSGMGLAGVECVAGCECRPSAIDGFWATKVSLTQMHAFRVRWNSGSDSAWHGGKAWGCV